VIRGAAIVKSFIPPAGVTPHHGAYPAQTLGYIADVKLLDGSILRNQTIGRPEMEVWEAPLWVRPRKPGDVLKGELEDGRWRWWYVETPLGLPCLPDQDSGGGT